MAVGDADPASGSGSQSSTQIWTHAQAAQAAPATNGLGLLNAALEAVAAMNAQQTQAQGVMLQNLVQTMGEQQNALVQNFMAGQQQQTTTLVESMIANVGRTRPLHPPPPLPDPPPPPQAKPITPPQAKPMGTPPLDPARASRSCCSRGQAQQITPPQAKPTHDTAPLYGGGFPEPPGGLPLWQPSPWLVPGQGPYWSSSQCSKYRARASGWPDPAGPGHDDDRPNAPSGSNGTDGHGGGAGTDGGGGTSSPMQTTWTTRMDAWVAAHQTPMKKWTPMAEGTATEAAPADAAAPAEATHADGEVHPEATATEAAPAEAAASADAAPPADPAAPADAAPPADPAAPADPAPPADPDAPADGPQEHQHSMGGCTTS